MNKENCALKLVDEINHQGAVSCLAKTTNMILRARRYWRDQCHGGIPACCTSVLYSNDEHVESYLSF